MHNQNPLLEIKNLSVEFNTSEGCVYAINNLSYALHEKEILGIVGESGGGKSVSSLAVMKLIPNPPGKIVQGEIFYKQREITTLSEKEMQKLRGNEISMIFQESMTSLNPIISCGKQIAQSLILHRGMKKKEAMVHAIEMMKKVGIANPEQRAHEYPYQMSGGMKQRIMIAMALACHPNILICDEPTTALDVTIQAQILDLIRKLNKETGTAVIMITHDLGVISELCERVIVMYSGRIVEEALVDDLFSFPGHPYTQGLIKAIPQITPNREKLTTIEGSVPNPMIKITGCPFYERCHRAKDICKEKEPPRIRVGTNHYVTCWDIQKKGEAHAQSST